MLYVITRRLDDNNINNLIDGMPIEPRPGRQTVGGGPEKLLKFKNGKDMYGKKRWTGEYASDRSMPVDACDGEGGRLTNFLLSKFFR